MATAINSRGERSFIKLSFELDIAYGLVSECGKGRKGKELHGHNYSGIKAHCIVEQLRDLN